MQIQHAECCMLHAAGRMSHNRKKNTPNLAFGFGFTFKRQSVGFLFVFAVCVFSFKAGLYRFRLRPQFLELLCVLAYDSSSSSSSPSLITIESGWDL